MATSSSETKGMSDEERQKLSKSLDEDLDNFIDGLTKTKYKEGWTEENWEEEMQQHPFFRSKPLEDGEELPPLIEGLQKLKYDTELHSEEELAAVFKEDGNVCFKAKKYRHAVDNYSEGLRKRHPNTELITQLLTNRAAAHFHLENFRSSLNDCERAVVLTPGHLKAVVRGAQCCARLGRHAEAVQWCDRGLAAQPDHSLLVSLRNTAATQQKVEERDRRLAARREKAQQAVDDRLLEVLRERGVRLASGEGGSVGGAELTVDMLTPQVPGLERSVRLTEAGCLSWPLIFLYPEHSESDLVQEAAETDTIGDHLEAMFGPEAAPPDWDPQQKYTPDKLDVFYETEDGSRLVPVPPETSLQKVLADSRYVVKGGVPGFIVLLRDSSFQSQFLSRYSLDPAR